MRRVLQLGPGSLSGCLPTRAAPLGRPRFVGVLPIVVCLSRPGRLGGDQGLVGPALVSSATVYLPEGQSGSSCLQRTFGRCLLYHFGEVCQGAVKVSTGGLQ